MPVTSKKTQLLLLPGFDGTGELFTPLISALDDSVEIIVVCYENEHVLEDYIDTVAAVLARTDCEVMLVAESFSGPIALSILARYPGRITSAVLSTTFAVSPFRAAVRIASHLPPGLLDHIPDRLICSMCLGRAPDRLLVNSVLSIAHAIPVSTVSARLKLLTAVDVRHLLPEIKTPILSLQAMQDRLVSATLSDHLCNGLENVTVRKIDGPHLLLQSQPDYCAKLVMKLHRLTSVET